MKSIQKLYDAFGELIYVIAMADGEIQASELKAIEKKLANHPWGDAIQWSFNYEINKHRSIEDLYGKVINYCEMHGPEPEYQFLLEVVEEVARASSGIDPDEQKVMDDFVHDLTEKFKQDIERINQG